MIGPSGPVGLEKSACCVVLKGKTCLSGGLGLAWPSRWRNCKEVVPTSEKIVVHYSGYIMNENV